MSEPQLSLLSPSSQEDSPARTSRWLEAVQDWLASGPDSSTNSCVSLLSSLPVGFSLRTSMAFGRLLEDGIWESSSGSWGNSGIGGPTVCLTLNTSDHPSGGVVSSLSDILERHVPPKYFLSLKACHGIQVRAARRGKKLPPELHEALQAVLDAADPEEVAALDEALTGPTPS